MGATLTVSVEERLREHIIDRGLKFSYVAKKANINNDWFSKSLNGKRRLSANELISLCVVLDIDLKYFIVTA